MPRKSADALAIFPYSGEPPRLSPPLDLAETERKIFLDIVTACKPGKFEPSDLPLLAAYCRAIALEREASARLQAEGYVVDGRPSAWLAMLTQASKTLLALSHRLRLSPQGRSPNVSAKPPVVSVYERMMLEGRRDDETDPT
jgi:phage terminase small subunit